MPAKRADIVTTETNPPEGQATPLHRPRFNVEKDGSLSLDEKSRASLQQTMSEALGIPFPSAGLEVMSYLFHAMDQSQSEQRINRMVEMLVSLKPKDSLEAMLAAQMVATHFTSMNCLNRANRSSQTFEGRNAALKNANGMMRTFTQQVETLGKYRNKGQQKIVIQHVQVSEGGQAMVSQNA